MSGFEKAVGRNDALKKLVCVFFLVASSGLFERLAGQFPEDGALNGWKQQGGQLMFGPDRLFRYIDGGAEMFLEFGFEELRLQKYRRQNDEIAVEVYRMENATAALGMYLLKCGRESPIQGIAARNSGDRFQIVMVQGRAFVVINNFGGARELLPVMVELASRVLASFAPVPEADAARVLGFLPRNGQIPGTQRILRGPYSLQAIYTFGDGDVLLLGGRIFGTAADYRKDDGSDCSRIAIRYPDGAMSREAFLHLLNHLDTHIRVLDRTENCFVFIDFENRYGLVQLAEDSIDIGVRYSRKPDIP